ncbi:Sulfur carrier protein adenylyltransferase ThiF [invertebrate metagenome]|uniref:Sulfur carrier protein adenylyltransferase ThiF n=1 Tax=invertebrate metagenome TaxID=1711999 RepID=A0A484H8B9_9ZZZZ
MEFSEAQVQRYARHILLPEVGGIGQARLLAARVLVVGAGGLGSPLLLYLAAAGVGTLGVVDNDMVELSNLQRQIAHATAMLGHPKVDSAAAAIRALNPEVKVEPYQVRLCPDNALNLISRYDVVADGSDNFQTRFLVNDACFFAGKPLVSAAILRFDGQLATFRPSGPCYRCLFPALPPPEQVQACTEAGVLGAVTGVLGALQATEVVKEILSIGTSMAGALLIYDALRTTFRRIRVKPDPSCPLCGSAPTLQDLSSHRSR